MFAVVEYDKHSLDDDIGEATSIWAKGVVADLEKHSEFDLDRVYDGIKGGFDPFWGNLNSKLKIINLDEDRNWQEVIAIC